MLKTPNYCLQKRDLRHQCSPFRYKSPSPIGNSNQMGMHHAHHGYGEGAHLHPQHHHHQTTRRLPPTNPTSLRRRVQSPNRRDFKDFSSHPRDFRSPMKSVHNRAYLEEDDDSGADSLGNDLSSCARYVRGQKICKCNFSVGTFPCLQSP